MAAGVPSTNQLLPFSGEALQNKSKMGLPLALPGLFYLQTTPSAANLSSGTVTDNGLSLIGANQLGSTTAGTLPWGGTAAVTFSSSSGLLCSFTTSSFMPTTLNYDQFPVKFSGTGTYVLPTGILANTTYYWQWVSASTGRLALTPGGTAIAYTDAGSGTMYCQAATIYSGSPQLPAGFLQNALTLNQATPSSGPAPGCHIKIEIIGNATSTTTNVTTVTPGFVSGAGTWTALTAGSALARVNAGPFPFRTTVDMVIQQYGMSAVTSPYNAIGMVRTVCEHRVYSTTSTNTSSMNIFAKTVSLDLTAPLTLDVRAIHATPAVAEYLEPLIVKMWAYN
jgi:hypothetical protein